MNAHVPTKPQSLLLLGPTGSGKSPLAGRICALGLGAVRSHHFDFGEELRGLVEPDAASDYSDREVRFVRTVLEEGVLLEDEHFSLARKIFSVFLKRSGHAAADRVILNGLPRHLGQARDMEDLVQVTDVVTLVCPAGEIRQRILLNTGGDRAARTDDTLEMIQRKLEIYAERTEPLVAHYTGRGARLLRIAVDRNTTPDEVYGILSGQF